MWCQATADDHGKLISKTRQGILLFVAREVRRERGDPGAYWGLSEALISDRGPQLSSAQECAATRVKTRWLNPSPTPVYSFQAMPGSAILAPIFACSGSRADYKAVPPPARAQEMPAIFLCGFLR